MSVSIDDVYKQVFEEHRFASEIRFKILAAWGASYTALAAVFLWCHTAAKSVSWLVPLVGAGLTVLFWLGDVRNRPAIGGAKAVGKAIEDSELAGIPKDMRFFGGLESGVRHGTVITVFAILMGLGFLVAAWYLFWSGGTLPA